MNYKIIPEKAFLREMKRLLKKYRSLKQDLENLGEELHANPEAGVSLGGGVRKVRWRSAVRIKVKVMAHV